MAKLTKMQRRRLEHIRATLTRAEQFIMRPDIAFCRHNSHPSTSLDYVPLGPLQIKKLIPDAPAGLTPLTKEVGSELVLVFEARRLIAEFLEA